jgi:hypothetical protein
MLIINTKQLRIEQNKLLKAFNAVIADIATLGISGKDREDIEAILGKHFERKLSKLIEEHRALPEDLEKQEKEEKPAETKSQVEPTAATNGTLPKQEPAPAQAPGEDEDAF